MRQNKKGEDKLGSIRFVCKVPAPYDEMRREKGHNRLCAQSMRTKHIGQNAPIMMEIYGKWLPLEEGKP